MLVLDMLFVVSAVLFDMLKARQLACVSKSGQKCPAALSPHGERGLKSVGVVDTNGRPSLSSWRAWIEIGVCIVPAAAWMLLSLFMSSVPRTCGIPHVRDC